MTIEETALEQYIDQVVTTLGIPRSSIYLNATVVELSQFSSCQTSTGCPSRRGRRKLELINTPMDASACTGDVHVFTATMYSTSEQQQQDFIAAMDAFAPHDLQTSGENLTSCSASEIHANRYFFLRFEPYQTVHPMLAFYTHTHLPCSL